MRIGIDARPIEETKITGIGVYLKNILSYLFEHDSKNEYFIFSTKRIPDEFVLPSNFKNIIVNGKIGTLVIRYKIRKQIKQLGIDEFWGTEHILPKPIKGVKSVLTVHDIALLINSKWGSNKNVLMQKLFAKPSMKEANQIITISNSTKNDLVKHLHVDKEKISVIYLAANIPSKLDISAKPKFEKFDPKNKKYFLFIGTIEPRKNIANMIKAFDVFSKENEDYHLLLAGGLGWKYKNILQTYQNSPYKEQIHFLGYLSKEQKDYLYSNCIAVAFPTNYEGFGLPLLEAMSFGVPIVSSDVSSIPEIGKDMVLYCNPKDVNSISLQLKKACELNKQERENLSKKEKEYSKSFKWEECGRKTLEILTKGEK